MKESCLAWPKPLLTEFDIHLRLESCACEALFLKMGILFQPKITLALNFHCNK